MAVAVLFQRSQCIAWRDLEVSTRFVQADNLKLENVGLRSAFQVICSSSVTYHVLCCAFAGDVTLPEVLLCETMQVRLEEDRRTILELKMQLQCAQGTAQACDSCDFAALDGFLAWIVILVSLAGTAKQHLCSFTS